MQMRRQLFILSAFLLILVIASLQISLLALNFPQMMLKTKAVEVRSFFATDFALTEGIISSGSVGETTIKDGIFHELKEEDIGSGYGLNLTYIIQIDSFTDITNLNLKINYDNQLGFTDFIQICILNCSTNQSILIRTDNTNGEHWENSTLTDTIGIFDQQNFIKVIISDSIKTDLIQNEILIDFVELTVMGIFQSTTPEPPSFDPQILMSILIFLVPFVAIIGIFCTVMIIILRKYKRREKLLTFLKESHQRVGTEGMKRAILMMKVSGSVVNDIHFKTNNKGNEFLVGGFFTALSKFAEQHDGNLRFVDFQGFKTLVVTGELLRMVVFFEGQPEDLLEVRLLSFLTYYENANKEAIINFNGSVKPFDSFGMEFFNYIKN